MRVLFDDNIEAGGQLVGKKLNYLSMGEVLEEESTSLVVSRGAEATPDPFTTDTRIASLGNMRVWELAACMITASIILRKCAHWSNLIFTNR